MSTHHRPFGTNLRQHLRSLVLFFALTSAVQAADQPFEFTDLDGKLHTPLVAGEKKAVVLIFVSPSARSCWLPARPLRGLD